MLFSASTKDDRRRTAKCRGFRALHMVSRWARASVLQVWRRRHSQYRRCPVLEGAESHVGRMENTSVYQHQYQQYHLTANTPKPRIPLTHISTSHLSRNFTPRHDPLQTHHPIHPRHPPFPLQSRIRMLRLHPNRLSHLQRSLFVCAAVSRGRGFAVEGEGGYGVGVEGRRRCVG